MGNPCCQSCGIVMKITCVCQECRDIAKKIVDLGLWKKRESTSEDYKDWVTGWAMAIYVLEQEGQIPTGTYLRNRSIFLPSVKTLQRRLHGPRNSRRRSVGHPKTLREVFASDPPTDWRSVPDFFCEGRISDVRSVQSDDESLERDVCYSS